MLFLLTLLWSGQQDALPNDILHFDFITVFGRTFAVREFLIFLLLFSMAISFPRIFREIAIALVLFWTLPLFDLSHLVSLSGAVSFGGLTIFMQKPKNKIAYIKKINGGFEEGYI